MLTTLSSKLVDTWVVFHHLSQPFLPAVRVDDSVMEESCKEGEDSSQTVEQHIQMHRCTATLLLDSLNKAAVHLRRAMVLYTDTWTCITHTSTELLTLYVTIQCKSRQR